MFLLLRGRHPQSLPGGVDDELSSVFALDPRDAWAVGYYFDATANHYHTLTEHWDGSSWSVVPSPNPGNANNYLYGVAAISRKDVWAVDFAQAVHVIDDRFPYVLAVRDVASGMQLAGLPVADTTPATLLPELSLLFTI